MKCTIGNIATTYSEKYTTVCQYMAQHQFLILIKKISTKQISILYVLFTLLNV